LNPEYYAFNVPLPLMCHAKSHKLTVPHGTKLSSEIGNITATAVRTIMVYIKSKITQQKQHRQKQGHKLHGYN